MKKILSTLFVLSLALTVSAQTMRVAILETVDKEGKIPYSSKLMLRANLSKAITNTPGYEAYDRTDMDAILGEQNFQRTGMVSSEQIKRLGELTGANYILVAEAAQVDSKNFFITAKILDVETARTVLTDNTIMGTSAGSIQQGCVSLAEKMFGSSTMAKRSPVQQSATESRNTSVPKTTTIVNHETTPMIDPSKLIVRNSNSDIKLYGKERYTYNGTEMDKRAMEAFLKNNCPAAYKQMIAAKQCKAAGWTFFGVGLSLMAGGGAVMAIYPKWNDYHYRSDEYVIGVELLCSGGGLVGASAPLLTAGYVCYNTAYKKYNKQCASKIAVNVTGGPNGLGLAFVF